MIFLASYLLHCRQFLGADISRRDSFAVSLSALQISREKARLGSRIGFYLKFDVEGYDSIEMSPMEACSSFRDLQ